MKDLTAARTTLRKNLPNLSREQAIAVLATLVKQDGKTVERQYHGKRQSTIHKAILAEVNYLSQEDAERFAESVEAMAAPVEAKPIPAWPKAEATAPLKMETPNADAVGQLTSALSALMGKPQIDMDQIQSMISESVAAAVNAMQPKRVYVGPESEWTPPEGEHVHEVFETVTKLAAIPGQNIMLVGPAGCGKTQLAAQVAKALGRRFASISCSAGMSESQLAGWLMPTGDNGTFEYVSSDFVDFYENGGVFLIDELDAGDENTLVFMNQALANGGFHVPQRIGRTYVKKHPNFVCIAAANTFGHGADRMYAGRNKLDGATLDRFRSGTVEMGYDAGLEETIISPVVLSFIRDLRKVIDEQRLFRVASTRAGIDISKQVAAGFTLDECKNRFFSDWTKDERAKVAHLHTFS